MKFIIFNLVVAAALIFLFVSDRGTMVNVASKAEEGISRLKSKVTKVTKSSSKMSPSDSSEDRNFSSSKKPVLNKLSKNPKKQEIKLTKKINEKKFTKKIVSIQPISAPRLGTFPALTSDVSQRRKKILQQQKEVVVGKKETLFMDSKTRKTELLLLAEEMELFAVKMGGE